jgi:carbonic anhydrase
MATIPTMSPHKYQTIRNTLLKLFVLAILLSSIVITPKVKAGNTDILLLTCMDYRLINETENLMTNKGLRDKYDQIILAGASLGANNSKFPVWKQVFWEHLKVAIDLHHIHKVVILDHRDCGAYKVILGQDFAKNASKETSIHTQKMRELAQEILKQYPKIEVELLLMNLEGKAEEISLGGSNKAKKSKESKESSSH